MLGRKRTLAQFFEQSQNTSSNAENSSDSHNKAPLVYASAKQLEQSVLQRISESKRLTTEKSAESEQVNKQSQSSTLSKSLQRRGNRLPSILFERQLYAGRLPRRLPAVQSETLRHAICHRYRKLPVQLRGCGVRSLRFDPSGILLASLSSVRLEVFDFDEYDIVSSRLENAREIVKNTTAGKLRYERNLKRQESCESVGETAVYDDDDWDECRSEEEANDSVEWSRTGNWHRFAKEKGRVPSMAKRIEPVLSIGLPIAASVVRWNQSRTDFVTISGHSATQIIGYNLNHSGNSPVFQVGVFPRSRVLGFPSFTHFDEQTPGAKYLLVAGSANGKLLMWDIRKATSPVWETKSIAVGKHQHQTAITNLLHIPNTTSIVAGSNGGQLFEFDIRKMDIPLFGGKMIPKITKSNIGFGGSNIGVAGMILSPDRHDQIIFQLKNGHVGIFDRVQRRVKPVIRYRPPADSASKSDTAVVHHYAAQSGSSSETMQSIPGSGLVSICFPEDKAVQLFSFSPKMKFGSRICRVELPHRPSSVAVHPSSSTIVCGQARELNVVGIAPTM